MAEMSVIWLRVAAVLYSLGLLHAILTLVRKREHLFRVALAAFAAGRGVPFRLHRGRGPDHQPLPYHQLLRNALHVRVPGGAAFPVRALALQAWRA